MKAYCRDLENMDDRTQTMKITHSHYSDTPIATVWCVPTTLSVHIYVIQLGSHYVPFPNLFHCTSHHKLFHYAIKILFLNLVFSQHMDIYMA